MKKLIFTLLCTIIFVSCAGKKETEQIIVASAQADCVGVAPQKCLLIKFGESTNWLFHYSGIDGFEYEPGFEYVLEVKKQIIDNPAADQSSVRYELVKVISKTAKTSDDLPPSVK